MLDRLVTLESAVRRLEQQIAPLLPAQPAPQVVGKDAAVAQREFDEAQAEVQNQKDRAALNVKDAEAAVARAKAVLDKSNADAKAADAQAAKSQPAAAAPPRG